MAALRATWPAFVALAVYAGARTLVLEGLGGGHRASLAGAVSLAPEVVERYAPLLAYPEPWLGEGAAVFATAAVFALLAACLLLPVRFRERPLERRRPSVVPLAVCWLLLLLALVGASGNFRSWYALAFLPAFALLVGAVVDRGRAALRAGAGGVGLATFAAVAAMLVLQWGGRFALDAMEEKRAAGAAARDLVERFARAVEAAPPGTTVELDARPPEGSAQRYGVPTNRSMTLANYSLEAWLELAMPERRVRIDVHTASPDPPAPDEVLVVLRIRELRGD